MLHVGGAESFLEAWCNGSRLGFSKDTRLPSEFDLTPCVRGGANLLAFMVIRYSDASYIEDQDQWWYGGIYRSVYLYLHRLRLYRRRRRAPSSRLGSVEVAVKLGFTFDPHRRGCGHRTPSLRSACGCPRVWTQRRGAATGLSVPALLGPNGSGPAASPSGRRPGGVGQDGGRRRYRLSRWEARLSLPWPPLRSGATRTPRSTLSSSASSLPPAKRSSTAACRAGFLPRRSEGPRAPHQRRARPHQGREPARARRTARTRRSSSRT